MVLYLAMLQLPTIFFLIAFSMLSVLHNLAIQLFLYWHLWWFDIPMHAFGGVIVALGFFVLSDLRILPRTFLRIVPITALVLGVALIWEAFELIAGVEIIGHYIIDTTVDITAGLIGGVIGFYIGKSLDSFKQ